MRKLATGVIGIFEKNAVENGLKLGINTMLLFGIEGTVEKPYKSLKVITVPDGKKVSFFAETKALCNFLYVSDNLYGEKLRLLLKSVSYLPEGTTVIFTHSEEAEKIETLLSEEGFRTIEHFNADRAAEGAFPIIEKDLNENTFFCLAVRKQNEGIK